MCSAAPHAQRESILQSAFADSLKQQGSVRLNSLVSLIEAVGNPLLLCDRTGRLFIASTSAQKYVTAVAPAGVETNVFRDLLHIDADVILGQLEDGEAETKLQFECPHGIVHAHVHALPDTQWLLVRLNPEHRGSDAAAAQSTETTVQALLEE